ARHRDPPASPCLHGGRGPLRRGGRGRPDKRSAAVCAGLRLNKNEEIGERALFRNESKGWIDIELPFLY
ncbi:MAG: hypothetical protein PVI71_06740, partial [Desulfobacterales bacterium]